MNRIPGTLSWLLGLCVGGDVVNIFDKPWHEEIREVTESAEFQTVTVQISDPSLLVEGDFDVDTGKTEYTGNPVLYLGRGRVIGVRWGTNSEGTDVGNSETISAIRVQIPRGPIFNVRRGCTLTVVDAPYNRALERYLFTATSDIQGGSTASRTFQFAVSSDAMTSNEAGTPRLVPGEGVNPSDELFPVSA